MAEFALGLTKTAVEGTLIRVKTAIEEEAKLKVRVQNDLLFITCEFEMMQSFLKVANSERTKNEVVRTWVGQLRDLAYDVEDCVEFVVHLDKTSEWTSTMWRLVSSCICIAPPPLDVAVAEIKQLKARVEDVSHRNTRYNLISDSGSSSNSAVAAAAIGIVVSAPAAKSTTASPGATAGASPTTAFNILSKVWEAAGKKRRGTGDLRTLITREGSDLQVISLYTGLGCGAAAAAAPHVIREVYNDPEMHNEFRIRAWVKLMHPFNPEEFLNNLQTQFYATSSYHPTGARSMLAHDVDIKARLMERLRYLVILEDVSTVVEWEVIKMYLPDSNNGSRIIVCVNQLGLAISCTGEPYQVSELRHFARGQSLCSFIKKGDPKPFRPFLVNKINSCRIGRKCVRYELQVPGRRSDTSEFSCQLRCGGVISVWGVGTRKSTFVADLYTSITHKSEGFHADGVKFEKHCWVDVPSPFSLDVFTRRLLLSFYSDDFGAKEIAAVGEVLATQYCRGFLCDHKCFIVINGVGKAKDWDVIKSNLLSEHTKGCILVITTPSCCVHHEEKYANLARHFVDGIIDRAVNIKDLEADAVLRQLIKGCGNYGIGGKEASRRGRLFSDRMEEARIWTNKFGHVVSEDQARDLVRCLKDPGVISLWGSAGAGKLPLIRRIYYYQMLIVRKDDNLISKKHREVFDDLEFTKFSWVDVSYRPFNLTEFSWRLLLDFHSNDIQVKENAAVSMMKGQDDPIQGCRELMRQDRCFVVINGLRSAQDWNWIRDGFLSSEPSRSCIVVITNEETVATNCAGDNGRVINIKGLEAEVELRPLIKGCGYYGNESDEVSRFFSNRREKAADYAKTFELVGCQDEAAARLGSFSTSLLSVWGIAGVGKSAITRSVYCHKMLHLDQHFNFGTNRTVGFTEAGFTSFSWVDVPNPFNLKELCWHLLLDFHSDDLVTKESTAICMVDGTHDPVQECLKFLQTRCFVVMDGLRSTHDWDLISDALLSEPTRGRIIVIANEANVASYCTAEAGKAVINAKGLEPDAALHLFQKVALDGRKLSPPEIEDAKLTMVKCGGLPKVITATAKLYREKPEGLTCFLGYLNDNFMGMVETNSTLRGLLSWMQSYFDVCSDSLKPCIFYLSVFPSNHKRIRRRRLLTRWIAEGYSREKFGMSAEEDGERMFSELVKLSIIQELPSKLSDDSDLEYNRMFRQRESLKVGVFQVNGFFHGYIMSRPMEDNLVFALEGHCSPNLKHAGQHLTIRSSWDRDENVFKSMDLSRLRSLTVFGKWMSFFISKDNNMRLLRVLDLEDTSGITDSDLEQMWKLLTRLKFLSLRGCKEITRLSDSFSCLRQLQTLDVRHTSIVELPRSIVKLHRLQYIRAGTSHCKSTSSEDSSTSIEDDNVTVPNTATSPADGNVVSTSQPVAAATAASTPPVNGDGTNIIQLPVAASTPLANAYGDDVSTSLAPPGGIEPMDNDGSSTSQPPAASSSPTGSDGIGTSTSKRPLEKSLEGNDGVSIDKQTTSTSQGGSDGPIIQAAPPAATPAPVGDDGHITSQLPLAAVNDDDAHTSTRRPCDLVFSWLSNLRRPGLVRSAHDGTRFPHAAAGKIGRLIALHTLGVVNVGGAGGETILKELKKLTQLRKLGVSGINRKNWHEFCSTISGQVHLESLSVRLEEDQTSDGLVFACFSDISEPPKTLQSLKVYGEKAHISLDWIKQLHNLTKVDLEVTTSTQEDIDGLVGLPQRDLFRRVCITPIQDGELKFGSTDDYDLKPRVIKIDCNYRSQITFQDKIAHNVEVLVVHCSSTGASLELSGLEHLRHVKEVWLKGSYSDAVKQYIQQKVAEHINKPVLMQ